MYTRDKLMAPLCVHNSTQQMESIADALYSPVIVELAMIHTLNRSELSGENGSVIAAFSVASFVTR